VVIRITYACNLACPHCLIDNRRRRDELDTPSWLKVLSELPEIGARKVLLTGGEPLLRKDLVEIVRCVSSMDIPVDLNSNLYTMTFPWLQEFHTAGLTEMSVSLEGPPVVHDSMHGRTGAFEQLVRVIKWAHDLGIIVDAAFCLTSQNQRYLDEIVDLAHVLPVQSLTISRLLPIGHARKAEGSVPQKALSETYHRLKSDIISKSSLPIRVVGLLNPPTPRDCLRGETLIGLAPNGALQACVLAEENPSDIPHPLEVGLSTAYTHLQKRLHEKYYRRCWSR
jgi:MoaA/NifB/PqqE/SkfB family radical SAM enzyme